MKIFLKISVSAALILIILSKVDYHKIIATIGNVDISLLIFTNIVFIFANVILCPLKIKLLLRSDGYHIPLREIISIYWIGMFFNRFLPGGIGGDMVKVASLARLAGDTDKAVSSVFMERLSGLLAIVPITLLSMALYYRELPFSLKIDVSLFVFAVLLFTVVLFSKRIMGVIISLLEGLRFKGSERFMYKIRSSYLSFYSYKNHGLVLFQVFILALLFYLLTITGMWLLALSINLNAPMHYFFIFLPIIFIIETIPISIGGIGVRESAYIYFFSMAGFSSSLAVSLSFLHFFLGIVNSSIGGIIFVFRR